MSLLMAALAPHPPLLIPDIGKGRLGLIGATQRAMVELGRRLAALEPERLVLITPHGPVDSEAVTLTVGPTAFGSFERFGCGLALEVEIDLALTRRLARGIQEAGLPVRCQLAELDHGLMVPLYYLQQAGLNLPTVLLSVSESSPRHHYRVGQAVSAALEKAGHHVALVASGDLSHRLRDDGPYGFDEMGPLFDRCVVGNLETFDPEALLEIPDSVVRRAGVCGLRPLATVLGALPRETRSRLLSYEGPFGVGYAVAGFEPVPAPVRLAREAVEAYATRARAIDPPARPEPVLRPRRAAFVTLWKEGELRGCIGTVSPVTPSLAHEIIRNAISACCRDPRFGPVTPDELPLLSYAVSVLETPEPIETPDELDPARFGLYMVSRDEPRRTGLLLPGIEQIRTAAQQVDAVRRKGGIGRHDPVDLFRFEVTRWD